MGTNMIKRVVGLSAWIVAWVGLVLAPIHALGRFATEAGKSDLDNPVVRAWAEPAARLLRPLLTSHSLPPRPPAILDLSHPTKAASRPKRPPQLQDRGGGGQGRGGRRVRPRCGPARSRRTTRPP